ncbi:MAG TPA: cytochrome c peroxidase [Longimicrobiales bacterium]|nr:cytochrome c peroxidase [Longimicrobiales bacterium]
MKPVALSVSLAAIVLAGCGERISESDPVIAGIDAQLRQSLTMWGVTAIAPMPAQDPNLVALGRALFFDKILSGNKDIACATCHQPAAALGDGLSLPVGTGGTGHGAARTLGAGRTFGPRQSPSLLNSGLGLFYMFWDGRLSGRQGFFNNETGIPLPPGLATALIAQAMLPVLNRQEMRGNPGDRDRFGQINELAQFTDDQSGAIWQAVMQRLLTIPEYVALFNAAFPTRPASQLTFADAARALATFQMDAFTKTRSAFDRYLERDNAALSAAQKRGALLFFDEKPCGSCHNGPFIGGQGFANVGVPQIGPGVRVQLPLDLGRGELEQHNSFYRFAFRVAPLRNVELTAPYMHSGAYATLEAVVEHYNNVPLAIRTYDTAQLDPDLLPLYHGDEATIKNVLTTLDGRLQTPLNLTDGDKADLVAFLKSLTDPAARNLAAIAPTRVPSGLPVN